MHEIEGRLRSYKDAPWCSNPKAYQNIVHEDENVIVFKDRYPVTEGHLLFVPKKRERRSDITNCFAYAYEWGVDAVCNYEYEAFNIGINNGEAAGEKVTSVPQVVVDGKYIGGYTEVERFLKKIRT